jgi:hypothetical protein
MTLPFFIATALAAAVATAQTATPEPRATHPPTSGAHVQSPSPAEKPDRASAQGPSQGQQQSQARQRSQAQSQSPKQSAQSQSAQSQAAQSATTETRPDANYPQPSGQDSQPDNSSHKTRVATGDSKRGTGTANHRGSKESDQNREVRKLSERKGYTGSSGSKADTSTACSTARPAADGGVNCGTSGNSATEGTTVTKPH